MYIPPRAHIMELAKRDSLVITSSGNHFQTPIEDFDDEWFKRTGQKDASGDRYYEYLDELQKEWTRLDANLEKLRKADPTLVYKNNRLASLNVISMFLKQTLSKDEYLWYREMLRSVIHTKPPQKPKLEVKSGIQLDESLIRVYLEQDKQVITTEQLPEFSSVNDIGEYFTNRGAIKELSYVRPLVTINIDGKTYRQHLWDAYKAKSKPIKQKFPRKQTLNYPFRSKPHAGPRQEILSDMSLKKYSKNLKKPSFSNQPGGYQIDLLSLGRSEDEKIKGYIMFLINENTKYVFTRSLHGKSVDDLLPELRKVISKLKSQGLPIVLLKSDAESTLQAIFKKDLLDGVRLVW